jgi:excisionase family DNA binding protein
LEEIATLEKPLLTVREVANLMQVHEKTVRRWVAVGKIPCIRVESRIRFARGDVVRWLSARKEE